MRVPNISDLQRMYWELSRRGAPAVGKRVAWTYRPDSFEALLALAAEMIRYDPRLLGIVLQLIVEREREIDPRRLRTSMSQMRWPQVLLVVFEFGREASQNPELHYMADYLAKGRSRIEPTERFFVDAERPAGRIAQRKLGRNLRAYARWGFVGTERPTVDAFTKRTVGRLDPGSRRRIARRLLERDAEVTMAVYLDAVDHAVSQPQAVKDLRAAGLVPTGRGRGTRWIAGEHRAPSRTTRRGK